MLGASFHHSSNITTGFEIATTHGNSGDMWFHFLLAEWMASGGSSVTDVSSVSSDSNCLPLPSVACYARVERHNSPATTLLLLLLVSLLPIPKVCFEKREVRESKSGNGNFWQKVTKCSGHFKRTAGERPAFAQ